MARTLALLLVIGSATASAGRLDDLVLVASRTTPIQAISERDLRRVFVGIAPEAAPAGTRAIFNDSDPEVGATFLRGYLFMTPSHYERLLAGRRYRDGQTPLARAGSESELSRRLQRDPLLLGFVPRDRLKALVGVKVVPVR